MEITYRIRGNERTYKHTCRTTAEKNRLFIMESIGRIKIIDIQKTEGKK